VEFLQRAADRLLEVFVPKVAAKGFWYTEYSCTPGYSCYPYNFTELKRNCYDATGYCTPWQEAGWCC
jgi:hypothetical protein